MKTISIWNDLQKNKTYPSLNKDIITDVLIIGGGITGISTAYHLMNKDLKVCLIEKNKIANGVTSRTTGKLTYFQENMYEKIKTYHGLEKTKIYLESQKEAIEIVKNIVKEKNIDCDLEKVNSYIFTTNKYHKLYNLIKIFNNLNIDFKFSNKLPNNKKINDSIYVEDTYVFHPLKYLYGLANIIDKNIPIYENTKVVSIKKDQDFYLCQTETNTIKAKYIVIATHYPYFLLPFLMPLKSYIEKSYIEAYKTDKNNRFSSISISKPIISTRYCYHNNNLYELFLSSSHNTCIKDNNMENIKYLLKNNNPDYIWSNKDIITNDSLPYIGSINKNNTFLIATGYNTWGMTNGSIAGSILADIILNKKNKYIELFNPNRKINLGKIINFPLILSSNAYSFFKSKLNKQKSWYTSNVIFEKRNGKNIAIYIDENKKEHIVYNICPHLKCSLIFNEVEHTWDCPCHGSRFDIDGNSIEGPSNYSIKYKQ